MSREALTSSVSLVDLNQPCFTYYNIIQYYVSRIQCTNVWLTATSSSSVSGFLAAWSLPYEDETTPLSLSLEKL